MWGEKLIAAWFFLVVSDEVDVDVDVIWTMGMKLSITTNL